MIYRHSTTDRHPHRLSLSLFVAFVCVSSALILGACGDSSPTPGQPSGPVIPGNGGAGQQQAQPPAAVADPYASYTKEQVADTFIKAYSTGDLKTVKALISPMVKAGWKSPDELDLQLAQLEKEDGKLEVINYAPVQGTDTGNKITYVVNYKRNLPVGAPTITPGRSLGGGTIGPEVQATAQAEYLTRHAQPGRATVEVRRENNAYKVSNYTIF